MLVVLVIIFAIIRDSFEYGGMINYYQDMNAYRRIAPEHGSTDEIVNVTVYYESLCPDSRDFFTQQLTRLYKYLGANVNVEIYPYGKASTTIMDDKSYYEFRCQNGPDECFGNKLHACAIEFLPTTRQAVLFNACLMDYMNTNRGSNEKSSDKCGKSFNIDSTTLKNCAKGTLGTLLLNYYGQISKMIEYRSVPFVLVNGGLSNSTTFLKDVCSQLNSPPDECLQLSRFYGPKRRV